MPLVLVAEDDPDVQVLVSMVLQQAGYECRVANNGGEALDLVRQHRPDLILMDVAMPGDLSGVEVTRMLRDEGCITTPIILMSAHARVEDSQLGLSVGASDYMIKPFDIGELLAKVSGLLSSSLSH